MPHSCVISPDRELKLDSDEVCDQIWENSDFSKMSIKSFSKMVNSGLDQDPVLTLAPCDCDRLVRKSGKNMKT